MLSSTCTQVMKVFISMINWKYDEHINFLINLFTRTVFIKHEKVGCKNRAMHSKLRIISYSMNSQQILNFYSWGWIQVHTKWPIARTCLP